MKASAQCRRRRPAHEPAVNELVSASRPKDLDGVGRRLCDDESMTPRPDVGGLEELTITIVVDNATDTLSSVGPGVPQLPELASLLMNIPPTGHYDGHDCVVAFDHLCVACHGFSGRAQPLRGRRRLRRRRCRRGAGRCSWRRPPRRSRWSPADRRTGGDRCGLPPRARASSGKKMFCEKSSSPTQSSAKLLPQVSKAPAVTSTRVTMAPTAISTVSIVRWRIGPTMPGSADAAPVGAAALVAMASIVAPSAARCRW